MELKTRIKQIGNSAGIILTKENLEVYDLKIGDIVDVDLSLSGSKIIGIKKETKKEGGKRKNNN